ncbi:hypothetical protein [Thalassotalea ganghwensis]
MNTLSTLLNKTTLAMLFSVAGATASMSAIANMSETKVFSHKIEIDSLNDANVTVYVNSDGDTQEFIFSKDELENKADLEAALETLPDEIRDEVVASLTNIENADGLIKLHLGDSNHKVFNWVGGSDEKVFVIEKESLGELKDEIKQKVKKFHFITGDHDIKVKDSATLQTDIIANLIKRGTFSQDDLNRLQQALDAKR